MDTKRIEIASQGDVRAVAFADESQVIGGYHNGKIRRWKIEDGQQQGPTMQASGKIFSVVVSQDGQRIVTGARGGRATVWDAATHGKVLEFTEHCSDVMGADISSDSTKVVSVDWNHARIFSIASGKRLLPPLPHPHVSGVKFSPDGSRFATVSRDHGCLVYSTHNGSILFDSGKKGSTNSLSRTPLTWSSDGQQLFVGSQGKITCFDISKSISSEWSIHENKPRVPVASNGRFVACAAGSSVSLWDCVSHKQIGGTIIHATEINCVALSPSGRYLACGSADGKIAVHNLKDVLPSKYFDNSDFTALSPSLPSLIERSKAQAAKGLWELALQDANEAVEMEPSSPWGYEAKHAALHGAGQYGEAINAFEFMLKAIEQSHDPAIKQLRKNYVSPSDTTNVINVIVDDFLNNCPLVVINSTTGRLRDQTKRRHSFKVDPRFKKLVSSMTTKVDEKQIRLEVESFFGYVMFSHVWNCPESTGQEPSFEDVNEVKSVRNLSNKPLNEKLRNFCKKTRELGYDWAWSDTCCIQKKNDFIYKKSLKSMFRWYANSTATLVFLADVAHPSKPGDLTRSRWMTRAWTLQELLSPKTILFYDSEWELYLGESGPNHKDSPKIMQELADAIKIAPGTIVSFSPDDLGVREKLRLASTRNATEREDIAYSLIGIFQSDIIPEYGKGADALGQLLAEIVDRTGEVTVLAWSGKSSSYNSCLPASISVYKETPYDLPLLEGEELETRIMELRDKLPLDRALKIYNSIRNPPTFTNRHLNLPCIVLPVKSLEKSCEGKEELYCAKVSGIGKVEFTTTDDLPVDKSRKFVFVHPWIRQLRGPSSEVAWRPASESDNCDRALRMIAGLSQPFNGWLLVRVENQSIEEYKRVAADSQIVLPGLGTNIPEDMRAKVLRIR